MERIVRLFRRRLFLAVSGYLLASLLFLQATQFFLQAAESAELNRPNILLILADDMGYSDVGCYGSEIATPNIDSLAAGGLRYSQFYNTARCWPTRAALLTGYYAQQVNRDALPKVKLPAEDNHTARHPAHRNRPAWSQLLPELLRPYGYSSYHSGKWHLDGQPLESGFEHSYMLLDDNRFFTAKNHVLDGQKLPEQTASDDYYATTAIADHALRFLQEHERKTPDRPFFQYVAFTSPHFPLHAPAEDIARYLHRYQIGWDAIRAARWERMQKMQMVSGSLSSLEPEIGTPYTHHFEAAAERLGPGEINQEIPWDRLTAEQQTFQAAKMAIHAAMIDRMDQNIGRIVEQLRQSGDLDNTVIFVLSDNGASAEIMIRGDGHDPQAAPGSAGSYLCLGAGWSSAANTPFRRHKTWVHEGGVSTPLVVHWPAGIEAAGQWRQAVGHVIDIAPTIISLVGGQWPTMNAEHHVPPAPGRSLAPTFDKDQSADRRAVWWLHEENRAIRVGKWKLVAAKGEPWELYDLNSDRAETHNLAEDSPDRVVELSQLWEDHVAEFAELRKYGYQP